MSSAEGGEDGAVAALLEWASGLLRADSLEDLTRLVRQPPLGGDSPLGTALVVEDPGHELRRLALGSDGGASSGSLRFVESLVVVAPQYAALHAPWRGEFRASDHALLFPAGAGFRTLLMLPLRRRGDLMGVYAIAGREGLPPVADCTSPWLEHLAALLGATLERLFDRADLLRTGVTDPATGWNTRRYLQARMREEVARTRRAATAAACLVVDVDRLRSVNERYGLEAGDRVLREVASRLESQVRASDASAWLGGDEFAVLLPQTRASAAAPLANRILAAMRASPVELGDGRSCAVTVSIGIADLGGGDSLDLKAAADGWLAEAEAALYIAKQRGGDAWEIRLP